MNRIFNNNVVLGDGIRRNIATVSQEERNRFINAILQLDTTEAYPGGSSYWDLQDEIHQATHIHGGPAFLPWHRELCNRFEALLRNVDPELSLHYWDWTTDPRATPDGNGNVMNLFSSDFMGSPSGAVGEPFDEFDITRGVAPGTPTVDSDTDIISSAELFPNDQQYYEFRRVLESNHDYIHGYIGGDIGAGHSAFEDPFVFLLHSNVDRLWAMWQRVNGNTWRLDPSNTYGNESNDPLILENMEPWAGGSGLRPWAPPENDITVKNSKHPSIVFPPCYDTIPINVTSETPSITFIDIPEGFEAARAARFTISSCKPINLEIINGPGVGFSTPLGMNFMVIPTLGQNTTGFVWITYTGTSDGDSSTGEVTIRCNETNEQWIIPISANTVRRPTVAVGLVLDKSGSMNLSSGLGEPHSKRIDILKFAAKQFIDVIKINNGIGIVTFSDTAVDVMPITNISTDNLFDPSRITAKTEIDSINPGGSTSIGSGIEMSHNLLNPLTEYDNKALVVFTDGHQNASTTIEEVSDLINERVFAVGLGTPEQLDTAVLDDLTNETGGKLLLTGRLNPDYYFLLSKYFMQVLAGVTNEDIVVDPEGWLKPGQKHVMPFVLNDVDISSDVILIQQSGVSKIAGPVNDISIIQYNVLKFLIESPNGDIIDPSIASITPGITYINGTNISLYRLSLPIPIGNSKAGHGKWNVILTIDENNYNKYLDSLENNPKIRDIVKTHGVRFNLTIHAYSNVQMRSVLHQDSYNPGSKMVIRTNLTQHGIPLRSRAHVTVEVRRPDGTIIKMNLPEIEPGIFEGNILAYMAGTYHFQIYCEGKTFRRFPFTREEMLTGYVWKKRDAIPPDNRDNSQEKDDKFCKLLKCLLSDKVISQELQRKLFTMGINIETIKKCLTEYCTDNSQVISNNSNQNEINKLIQDPTVISSFMKLFDLMQKRKSR